MGAKKNHACCCPLVGVLLVEGSKVKAHRILPAQHSDTQKSWNHRIRGFVVHIGNCFDGVVCPGTELKWF